MNKKKEALPLATLSHKSSLCEFKINMMHTLAPMLKVFIIYLFIYFIRIIFFIIFFAECDCKKSICFVHC